MAERGWITTGEAAKRLGVHPETVRRWGRDKLLRVERFGGVRGHRRVDPTSIDEYLQVTRMEEGPERDAALEDLKRRNSDKDRSGGPPPPPTSSS